MDIAVDFVDQVHKFHRKSVPKFRKKFNAKILKLTLFIIHCRNDLDFKTASKRGSTPKRGKSAQF